MMQNTRGEWSKVVSRVFARKNWSNYELGVEAVRALGYPSFYGPPGSATILDGYPGAGVFASCLHNEIKPRKHVLLEPLSSYCKFLETLESDSVIVEKCDPYRWSSFTKLLSDGKISPSECQWPVPRTQVNNKLLYTANLTHTQGEQLVAQYLNCISNQSWIQRFGRVRLLLWMRAATAEKLLAGPSERFRHRLGAQRESCCDARVVFHQPTVTLEKMTGKHKDSYPHLLQSPLMQFSDAKNPRKDFVSVRSSTPLSLVELTPLEHQVEHIDEFEYVLRMLFVLSGTPLRQGLESLGPGACDDLGPKLHDILHLKPTQLTIDNLKRIADVFWRWPFKPETLMDFYEEATTLGNGSAEMGRN